MIRIILAAALIFAATNAEARQRHKSTGLHPSCFQLGPNAPSCGPVTASTADQARVTRGRWIARSFGIGTAIEKPVRKARKHVIRHVAEPRQRVAAVSPVIGSLYQPMRYIAGRLVCARNVNSALAERGIKGTGSALAKSFLLWGRSAGGPVAGAVIVSNRRGGGHVAIVSRVVNGVVFAWNATGGRHGWREIPYRMNVIDYRVPG